jgi:DNA topoisomerase-1
LVKKIGVACPRCGGELLERRGKTGKIFYGCEKYPQCEFTSWDLPLKEQCPKCGSMLLEHSERNGKKKIYCSNLECEDARPVRSVAATSGTRRTSKTTTARKTAGARKTTTRKRATAKK